MPKTASLREQFGQRLRALRLQHDLTQEQLAESAEISVDFLSLVERGINSPSFEVMERLAKSLKVPAKEFFDFER
jgi:transcriptional regulator with XRE-family HTH domain